MIRNAGMGTATGAMPGGTRQSSSRRPLLTRHRPRHRPRHHRSMPYSAVPLLRARTGLKRICEGKSEGPSTNRRGHGRADRGNDRGGGRPAASVPVRESLTVVGELGDVTNSQRDVGVDLLKQSSWVLAASLSPKRFPCLALALGRGNAIERAVIRRREEGSSVE